MDLGECPNIHELALRADYQQAASNKDYFYDVDVSLMYFNVLSFLYMTYIYLPQCSVASTCILLRLQAIS